MTTATITAFDDTLTIQTVPISDIHVMQPHPTCERMFQLLHGEPPRWVTAVMDHVLCGLGWHSGYAKTQAAAARASDPPEWPCVASLPRATWPRVGRVAFRTVMKHYMPQRRVKLRTEATAMVLHGVLRSIDTSTPEMQHALRRAHRAACLNPRMTGAAS